MNFWKATGAGVAAGLLGAGIWALIVYLTHREVGYVAWGVGGLVGIIVHILAQPEGGFKYGATAAGLALGAIVLGKFLAIILIMRDLPSVEVKTSPQAMISQQADEIVRDRQATGKKVVFPPGMTLDKASKPTDYPKDVWAEAEKKWASIPPAEQTKLMKERDKEIADAIGALKGNIRNNAFAESFSPFDLLWFGLAMFTAFRLGAGAFSSDD